MAGSHRVAGSRRVVHGRVFTFNSPGHWQLSAGGFRWHQARRTDLGTENGWYVTGPMTEGTPGDRCETLRDAMEHSARLATRAILADKRSRANTPSTLGDESASAPPAGDQPISRSVDGGAAQALADGLADRCTLCGAVDYDDPCPDPQARHDGHEGHDGYRYCPSSCPSDFHVLELTPAPLPGQTTVDGELARRELADSLAAIGATERPALALAQALGVAGIGHALGALIDAEQAEITLKALAGERYPEAEREARRRFAATGMTLASALRSVARDLAHGDWQP